MNTANGAPEIDPEYYTELRPLDENVLFAVSDPQVLGRQLTGAEMEAMEDEAAKRKENVLERFKRLNAKTKPTVTFDEKTYPVESVTIDYAWKNAEANAEYLIRGTGLLSPYKADGSRNTVYLAGPMTGYGNYNFPAFDAARDDLTAKGFNVVSPADIDREVGFDPSVGTLDDFDLPAAIRRDVDAILGCDAVVLLPGHETSKGATAERYVAKWAGKPCFTYPALNPYEEKTTNIGIESLSRYDEIYKSMSQELKDDADGATIVPEELTQAVLDYDETYPVISLPKESARYERFAAEHSLPKDGDTITNDRGGKQSFTSARFDCIPPECLRLLAQCLGFGARKYGAGNWRSIDIEDNIAHAMNHLNEYRLGDRSEPHLVNAMARVTFALSQAVANGTQSDVYVHPDQK